MNRPFAGNASFYLIAVLIAGSLKFGYSFADGGALRWILGPTAWLAGFITGMNFDYMAGAGYMSAGHDFLIAPVCAGINFLIICFCMLAFTQLHHAYTVRARIGLLAGLGLISYGVTVLVNAARIAISIQLFQSVSPSRWLSLESIHRIEGIAVYFLALSLLYCASEAVSKRFLRKKNGTPHAAIAGPRERRTLVVPLFWYLLITLGIPLLRMPFSNDAHRLLQHSITVLLIPVLMVLAYSALRRSYTWLHAHSSRYFAERMGPWQKMPRRLL